ncbi:MSHA biogenesis protein MshF [Vibrio sp. TRT 17S01]|uniref:MSHA biogenesis protein MshF n=1 Tax=Vibrio sp. TRT 17S01 TaxID=3418505 RepID=UPI003CF468A0
MLQVAQRGRFALWLTIVTVLIAVFLYSWKQVEKEAMHTNLLVASKRMTERASFYKQEWLLHGQPSELVVEQHSLRFSANGWLVPIDEQGNIECMKWLEILYPENRVLVAEESEMITNSSNWLVKCRYLDGEHQAVEVELKDGKFSVGINFIAK